jgi:hypothetical protein
MAGQPADGLAPGVDASETGELHPVLNVIGVLLLTASGVLAALLELLLIPLYAGKTLVPITVLLAVVTSVALPLLARELVPRGAAMIAPFAGWLLVAGGLGLFARPEGDVIIPGGGGGMEWTGWGVLLLGTLAGVVTIVVALPRPT